MNWKGLKPETLERAGVVLSDGNVIVPYYDPAGEEINAKIFGNGNGSRCWWRDAGKGIAVYGLETLAGRKTLWLAEGESDTLALREVQAELELPVDILGLPGSSTWSHELLAIVGDYTYHYVFGDGDEAGDKMYEKIRRDLPGARRVPVPAGEDVRSILQSQGADEVARLARLAPKPTVVEGDPEPVQARTSEGSPATTVDDVIARLQGVSKRGDGWVARCPAHDDKSPSLKIDRGPRDNVLLYCHAGCSFDDVMKALGFGGKTRLPSRVSPPKFKGLSYNEVLSYTPNPRRQLVEELVEAGTLGIIAGPPETFKSFFSIELAHKIATGGSVLNDTSQVLNTGPVQYWWQDDSEDNMKARVLSYASKHQFQAEPEITWYFNEGLVLPRDMSAFRDAITDSGAVFVVLDSLYQFLPGVDLKDEQVGQIFREIKAEVCDPTGCTVMIVDHTPWPHEPPSWKKAEKGPPPRGRPYGSVFKVAAIRWGIYLQRKGEEVWLESHGNNMRGRPPAVCFFNFETMTMERW